GQALVLRRVLPAAASPRRTSLLQYFTGADGQDERVFSRTGGGVQEHRGRQTDYGGGAQGRAVRRHARSPRNVRDGAATFRRVRHDPAVWLAGGLLQHLHAEGVGGYSRHGKRDRQKV